MLFLLEVVIDGSVDLKIDRLRIAEAVMDVLDKNARSTITFYEKCQINRLSCAIISHLASQISTEQTPKLGTERNINNITKLVLMKFHITILDPARERLQDLIETIFQYSLAALWNLSDEAPKTCEIFVTKCDGIQMCHDVMKNLILNDEMYSKLEKFYNQTSDSDESEQMRREYDSKIRLLTKILGLLSNVSEVSDLASHFFVRKKTLGSIIDETPVFPVDLIVKVLEIEKSTINHTIDAAYFAGGTLSHLLSRKKFWPSSENEDKWTYFSKIVCLKLCLFEAPDREMVVYRTFTPFKELLKTIYDFEISKIPAAIMWALWAVKMVTANNIKYEIQKENSRRNFKYVKMIVEGGLIEMVKEIQRVYKNRGHYLVNCIKEEFDELESEEILTKLVDWSSVIITFCEQHYD